MRGVRPVFERLHELAARRPLALLAAVGAAVETLAVWRILGRPGRPPLRDSIVLEYVGWYVSTGAVPYVDVWEVKPPLSYYVPAALAWVAPDARSYHLLAVALTAAMAVGVVVLVGWLALDLTGDPGAAVLAGLALVVLPTFHLRPAFGYKAKYQVLLAGLGAVALARRDRSLAAGAAGAAAAGTWQLGVVFTALSGGVAVARDGRRGAWWFLAGAAAVTALVVGPVVLAGAGTAMVVETVVVGATVPESGTPALRAYWTVVLFRWGLPVAAAGVVGAVLAARDGVRWLAAGVALSVAQLVLVDLDRSPDLLPLLALLAVGVGVAAARVRPWPRRAVAAAVLAAAAVSVAALGGTGLVFDPRPVPEAGDVAPPDSVEPTYGSDELRALYWHQVAPETCHVFLGRTQRTWLAATGRTPADDCGRPPDWLLDG